MIDDLLNPDWLALSAVQGGPRTDEKRRDALCFDTDAGPFEISVHRPGVFRVRAGARDLPDYGLLTAAQPQPFSIRDTESGAVAESAELSLAVDVAGDLTLTLRRGDQPLLDSSRDGHFVREHRLPPFCFRGGRWFGAFELGAGEPVYGLGEKWGPLNKRGQLLRSQAEDALGVNAEVSYKNVPFLWSPQGWGILFNTPATLQHAVGFPSWSARSYAFLQDDAALDLLIFAAADGAEALRRYAELTGFPPAVPVWSLGVWMSRAYYRTAMKHWRRRGIFASASFRAM